MHDGEDEAVEGAVGDLLRIRLAVHRGDLGLLAVEHIGSSLEALLRGREALEEQRQKVLADAQEGVEALGEGQLEVDKGSVLAAGRVGGELVGLLLAEHVLELGSLGQRAGEILIAHAVGARGGLEIANLDELVLQDGDMRSGPAARLAAVALGAPDVDDDNGQQEGQDVHLQLEVVERGALPHAVPCRVRATSNASGSGWHRRGGERGVVYRRWVGRTGIVGEVCAAMSATGRVVLRGPAHCAHAVRTTIISRRHNGLLGAEEPLDEVGHWILMPQWIAREDGVRLRPDGTWAAWRSSDSVSVWRARTNVGAMMELPQLFIWELAGLDSVHITAHVFELVSRMNFKLGYCHRTTDCRFIVRSRQGVSAQPVVAFIHTSTGLHTSVTTAHITEQ